MPVQTAEGVFNLGTGTGNVSVTGLMGGAQVAAVKVWWNGRTAAGVARGTVTWGTGITDGTNQACVTGVDKDAANPTNAKSGGTDDALIWTIDNTGATAGVAVLVSLDAGAFTVNVTSAFTGDLEVHYLAFAGYQAKVIRTANEPATATTAATTGVGFKGNIVNEIGAGSLASYAAGKQTGADYNLFDGWAVTNPAGTLRQGLMANGADDNVATTSTRQYFRSSAEVGAMFDATASATPKSRWAFTSFGDDGFTETYNVVVGSGTRNHFALVLRGGAAELQQFTTSVTGGATFTVTPGFNALGGFVSHGGRSAESTAGAGNAVGRFLLGAFAGTGSNHALGTRSSNAAAGGLCTTESNAANCVVNLNDGALSGAANVTAISATQVTWTMSTGDSAACFGFAVTFGDDPWIPDPSPRPAMRPAVSPLRAGDALPPTSAATPALAPPELPRALAAARVVAPWNWDVPPPLTAPGAPVPPPEAPRAIRRIATPPNPPVDIPPPQVGVFTGSGFPQLVPPVRARVIPPPLPFDAPPPIPTPPAPPVAPLPAPVVASAPARTFTQPQPPPPLQQPAAPAPFVVRAFRAIFHPPPPMPMPAQVFPPAPPPPEAPRAIRALQRWWRLVVEVGWPQTAGPVNTQVVRPPLLAVVDALDLTVSAPGVSQVAVFDGQDLTVTGDT